MLDWLRLIRASGLCTILSNTAAAVLVAEGGEDLRSLSLIKRLYISGWDVLWVPVASFCLYAAGMLWNDLNDIDRDRVLNPRRPLPSGRVSLPTAYVAGVLLSVGALVAGFLAAGTTGFHAAGAVLTLALLYDFAAKGVPYLGSLVMALVRASHALFALLLIGQDHFKMALQISHDPVREPLLLAYPLILGLYILGLTLISELESRRARRVELLLGGACIAGAIGLAVARVVQAPWIGPLAQENGVGPVLLALGLLLPAVLLVWLLLVVGRPYLEAVRSGKQAMAGATVFAGLGGIILLDAIVASSAHPVGALLIAMLYPVFKTFGAMIRMD